tara:strand:+ start:263 stop:1000 length:738 start_codon:yes stop_codon:yes gene_type:complete
VEEIIFFIFDILIILLHYDVVYFPKAKCIFIHIPKCGGLKVLDCMLGLNYKPVSRYRNHAFLKAFDDDLIKNNFKFTMIRNPWERIVSHYFFHGPGAPFSPKICYINEYANYVTSQRMYPKESRFLNVSFDDFVCKFVCNEEIVSSLQNYYISTDSIDFIKNNDGEIDMDYIGFTDQLLYHVRNVFNILGYDLSCIDESKINELEYPHYSTFYSDYTKEVVRDFFSQEIDYFDLKFTTQRFTQKK